MSVSTLLEAVLLDIQNTKDLAPHFHSRLFTRVDTCGGNPSLAQCGGSFPSDFCCPHSSICLPLNATGTIATVCCPPGVDCRTIQPTTCEQGAYNATLAPSNQVHASPVSALVKCGSACCPAGYSCQNGELCIAQATASNSTSPPASTQSLAPATSTAASSTQVPAVGDASPTAEAQAANGSFSGSSFAAGFVPGIVLGMILVAAFVWFMKRRKRNTQYNDEKALSQDQLTGLSPMNSFQQRPQPHMRSISEPTMLANGGNRSDFLRSSPSDKTVSSSDERHARSFDTIDEESSNPYEPRPMFQFSPTTRSPRSPLPAHLKRGTLSYAVSPIRQLKTKKSLQSLRRHAASPMRSNTQRHRSSMARSNTSASTETIQVLMTPDQRPSYVDTSGGYGDSHVPSSIYTAKQPWNTPSRQPTHPQHGMLGSPYSYQPRDNVSSTHPDVDSSIRDRRVTTFSSLMERAGLRKEDLLSGSSR